MSLFNSALLLGVVQTLAETTVAKIFTGEDPDFKNGTSSNPIFCTTETCNATGNDRCQRRRVKCGGVNNGA